MFVFPGLPPVQSHPVLSIPRQQTKGQVNWDMWRQYAGSSGATRQQRAHTGQSLEPHKGQRFDTYA